MYDAAATLQAAIVTRYETEITLARTLQDTLTALGNQATALRVRIAQAMGADATGIYRAQFDSLNTLQAGESDPTRRLSLIEQSLNVDIIGNWQKQPGELYAANGHPQFPIMSKNPEQ
jgi:hypothetical protein